MKQDVAVISLDAYAGQFYAQQVQELFGERITVCSYSVRDGSIEHMPRRYDLYMVTTDAFDSLGDLHQYVPIDGEMMEIHVTLRWDVVRRLQSLPAGKRALFVNLSDKMCREAVTRLNQLGVNQLAFDLYHPGAPEPDMGQYDFVITPQETRYVPAGAKEIIDIGQRVCDSSTMIEAALRLGLEELLDRHPYDLSGGEQQRAALAKVLLLNPEILLLDEPTKGLDAEFKQVFAEILQILLRRGTAVLMVSHDIEFCARYAHRCALFFDGGIVTEGTPRNFFSGNSFYTTAANRMARQLLPRAVTVEDVIAACGGQVPPAPALPEDIPLLPEPEEASADYKPKPLPWWRKLGAVLTGGVALLLFLQFMNVTDLTALVGMEGMTELASDQLALYAFFIAALFLFAACITRRSHRPDYLVQTPREKRKLSRRTLFATALILLLIPLTLYVGVFYLDNKKYYFISLMVLLECMAPFFLIFEGRKPKARELVIIAVLCAIAIAGRAALFMLPQFKPVIAMTIISGVAFGGETGFLVGAMTMLASNVMFSQGPWTPWQMFAVGIIGFFAGVLFRKGWLRRSRGALCVFGALSAILIYGGIMNPASALMWAPELNWKVILTYYVTGFPFDCIQAAATWLFLWFAAEPMLEKLDRIKVKYGLVE